MTQKALPSVSLHKSEVTYRDTGVSKNLSEKSMQVNHERTGFMEGGDLCASMRRRVEISARTQCIFTRVRLYKGLSCA